MTIWKRIRNILIRTVSLVGIAFLYRTLKRKNGPLVRVLVFHDVPEKAWFDGIVDEMMRAHHIVSPEEFQNGKFHPKKINILITFDDGYESWVTNVLPSLQERNLKALFFINSGLLDCSATEAAVTTFMKKNLRRTPRNALTWDGAKTLLESGQSIGGHSATHPNLAKLSGAALESELTKDKVRTESQLGVVLTEFAYPFGRKEYFNEETKRVLKKIGYEQAYSASSAFVDISEDQFEIPRLGIENVLTPKMVSEWVRGGYDIVQLLK